MLGLCIDGTPPGGDGLGAAVEIQQSNLGDTWCDQDTTGSAAILTRAMKSCAE